MESKTNNKTEENINTSSNPSQSSSDPQNNCVNFKELFLSSMEEVPENPQNPISKKENIEIIYKLFNIPPPTSDSFKNKELKLKYRSDCNTKFSDSLTVKYIGKGVSKIDYSIIQTEKEISNKRPVFYYEVQNN